MRSLRTRLLVGIVGGMLLLLLVFSLIIYTLIRRALVNQFDASLLSTARMLAASVEQDNDEIELEFKIQQMPEFQKTERPTYYQLWRQDGTVVVRSPSLSTDDLLRFESPLDEPVFQEFKIRTGQPARAVGFKFNPRIADSEDKDSPQPTKTQALTLVVAKESTDLQSDLRLLRWLLLIASGGAIIMSVFIATFVVRQSLSPLNSLAVEISAIKENDLTVRISTERMPTEMIPIKNRLNDLLARLEASFNRERRFTADVAHELRTPLAGIRSTIEVTLARPREVNEYQASLSDCLTITKNMHAMVNSLLTLARIDTNQMTFRRDQIQLAKLVNSSWHSFSHKALERSISFENRLPAEMTCKSDPDGLSMVLSNLLDNAAEYTNQGGQIRIEAHQFNNRIEITVANTGCQLTDEEVSYIFDCFWRGDSSRTGTGTHCGLGLALVQRIVQALGGSTVVKTQTGGIFVVRITLPAKGERNSIE